MFIHEGGKNIRHISEYNALQYNIITSYDLNAETYDLIHTSEHYRHHKSWL